MTQLNQFAFESLSRKMVDQIDHVCDQFERQWQSGDEPDLRGYLDRNPQISTDALLDELLRIELTYRRRLGDAANFSFYQQLFPQLNAEWFERIQSTASSSEPARRVEWFRVSQPEIDLSLGSTDVVISLEQTTSGPTDLLAWATELPAAAPHFVVGREQDRFANDRIGGAV